MNDEILKKSAGTIKKSLERVAKKKFADSPQVGHVPLFFLIDNK